MHGLINRSIQCFLRDTYGADVWEQVATGAELEVREFEALLVYDDAVTERMLSAATATLGTTRACLLEDLGVYLVSNQNLESIRRLLRFGGETFAEFLDSLDELPARSQMAVPRLELPRIDVQENHSGSFTLLCRGSADGFGHVLAGILRAIADDYGALVLLEHCGTSDGAETIAVTLLDQAHAPGRTFRLAGDGSSAS